VKSTNCLSVNKFKYLGVVIGLSVRRSLSVEEEMAGDLLRSSRVHVEESV
jgi:hypothetical protein